MIGSELKSPASSVRSLKVTAAPSASKRPVTSGSFQLGNRVLIGGTKAGKTSAVWKILFHTSQAFEAKMIYHDNANN